MFIFIPKYMHAFSALSGCLSYNMLAVIMGRCWTGVPEDNMFWWQIKRRIIEGNLRRVCVIRCIQPHPCPPHPPPPRALYRLQVILKNHL